MQNTATRLSRSYTKTIDLVKSVSSNYKFSGSNPKEIASNGALRLFWFNESPNLGDEISSSIVQKISGMEICHAKSFENNKFLAVGSIINFARSGDIVWGSGAIEPNLSFRERNFFVYAVRGPKTREVLLAHGVECPEIYGDPGIFISDIYPVPTFYQRTFKLGIIPHYMDKNLFKDWNDPSIIILDIQSGRKKFLDDLWQCQRVVSSSLHGIIFAESYGIPAQWMVLSNKIYGGEFKFHDYYLGTNREPPRYRIIDNFTDDQDWIAPCFNKEALLSAFPLEHINKISTLAPKSVLPGG